MKFNKSKCQALRVSGMCSIGQRSWCDCVCSDMSWSRHIEETVAKANRTLGLARIPTTKEWENYYSLVRPILEFSSNLWSPYTIKRKRLVENVQRRATKFILDYPQDLTYADRLAKIKILPLEFRRDISDLCLLFKSRTGAITTDVNKYICTFEPGYQSRNYDKNNYNLIIKHKQDYF